MTSVVRRLSSHRHLPSPDPNRGVPCVCPFGAWPWGWKIDPGELVQAVYLMRLPSGLLASYQVIELMPSEQMSEALKRSKKLIDGDTTLNGKSR